MSKIKISWVNECGLPGEAILEKPDEVLYSWWSSKKVLGKYVKTEVTAFSALISKLKGCTKISVKQLK